MRQIPLKILDPVHHFVDNESSESNLGSEKDHGKMSTDEIDSESNNLENSKRFGESVLWDKLEGWVEQYKKDIEFWGIGSNPIFTVFQDNNGNVERVLVDEDEILRRSGVDPLYFREEKEFDYFDEVNSKISRAKFLAREIECGKHELQKNSSVVKLVVTGENSGFMSKIRSISVPPNLLPKVSRVGIAMVCGFLFVWAIKKLFTSGGNETETTRFEKEMLRRKIKSRMKKEKLQKGSVEVVEGSTDPPTVFTERPQLDQKEVLNSIRKAKGLNSKVAELNVSSSLETTDVDMDVKIQEILIMARHAREIERGEFSSIEGDESDKQTSNELPVIEKNGAEEFVDSDMENVLMNNYSTGSFTEPGVVSGIKKMEIPGNRESERSHASFIYEEVSMENMDMELQSSRNIDEKKPHVQSLVDSCNSSSSSDSTEAIQSFDVSSSQLSIPKIRRKPKIILSVREAREYLSWKNDQNALASDVPATAAATIEGMNNNMCHDANISWLNGVKENEYLAADINGLDEEVAEGSDHEMFKPSNSCETSDILSSEQSLDKLDKSDEFTEPTNLGAIPDPVPGKNASHDTHNSIEAIKFPGDHAFHDANLENEAYFPTEKLLNKGDKFDEIPKPTDRTETSTPVADANKWLEKNFHEVEPIMKKIGDGFSNNYKVARERVKEVDMGLDFMKLGSKDDDELEWMQDDKLREIVFRVRENELAGRDPFHSMDPEDKIAFHKGLEGIVEKENEKLSTLHEWLHSNIENVDYGADGISIYDPPEKVIPRWKGPPIDKISEFLSYPAEQQEMSSFPQKVNGSLQHDKIDMPQKASTTNSRPNKIAKLSKTIVETSDGSIKPGKKSGKEFWQHTKKWSRGFTESYNSETDPEVKSVVKDIGKDLDRWITEKEIQEAADLMDKIPQRGKEYIEKKINKLTREMELFGPAAVVSKYSEYAEEKEEDYLWWLDLPYVMCIELYTYEGDDQRIGFYSLEMAADLEIDPKPHHVIAFQDPSDCKNLCYIIQAHLEMLGSGKAFVVAQPPKDVIRQANANGFGVTVIKKGEIQMDVDQPLEEVEELITEIGSKMYHDKLMRHRSVDVSSLMKGVFGINRSSIKSKRKRKKRARKSPRKQ